MSRTFKVDELAPDGYRIGSRRSFGLRKARWRMARKRKAPETATDEPTRQRMQYLGPDDYELGIEHARSYEVEVTVMKSGRYSVRINPDDYRLKTRRYKYADKDEFKMFWRTQ